MDLKASDIEIIEREIVKIGFFMTVLWEGHFFTTSAIKCDSVEGKFVRVSAMRCHSNQPTFVTS